MTADLATRSLEITEPGVYELDDAALRAIRVRLSNSPETALIDAADIEIVRAYDWYLLNGHNGKMYAYTTGSVYMHRLIAGTPAGMETDHRNGNGLDNRRFNLRLATPSQNRANMGKPTSRCGGHSSRYKGVSWDKTRNRWQAKITVLQVCRNLGRYDSEESAARAYDAAAFNAWGDFAWLNFPGSVAA